MGIAGGKDGTFCDPSLTVESEVEVPVRLALEEAEHASVKLNGKTVNEKVSGWYTDHCIGTIEIGTLQKGTNIVEATVPFTHRIGLEWCYLLGDFGVRIEGRAGVVTAPVRALSFGNIVPQGLPFYGGNITYHLPVSIGANGAVVHIPHYRGALVAVEKDGNGWVKRHLHPMIWKLDRLIRSIWCCLETASIPLAQSIWLERMTDS